MLNRFKIGDVVKLNPKFKANYSYCNLFTRLQITELVRLENRFSAKTIETDYTNYEIYVGKIWYNFPIDTWLLAETAETYAPKGLAGQVWLQEKLTKELGIC